VTASPSNGQKSNAAPFNGSLTLEQRIMIERIFDHYSTLKENGQETYLRFNKFLKMMHECRMPLDQTTLEIVFYGENRHQ
jgi:hypothetical protein